MELFVQKFQLSMASKVALFNRITHYIEKACQLDITEDIDAACGQLANKA